MVQRVRVIYHVAIKYRQKSIVCHNNSYTFIILSQKKELRIPKLYGLWSLYTCPLLSDTELRTKNLFTSTPTTSPKTIL